MQPLRLHGVTLGARVGENEGLRWCAPGQLTALGLPAPIRKLLEGRP